MKIQLPNAKDWNGAENYAINLRSVHAAGVKMCEPVGLPSPVLPDAGSVTFLLDDDHVLSASADRHDLFYDGAPAGSLPNALVNVLPLGMPGEAVVFTSEGAQWLSKGALQPSLANSGSNVAVDQGEAMAEMLAEVLCGPLSGNYPRLSEPLDDNDTTRVCNAIDETMHYLVDTASAKGLFALPTLVAWRLVDADGRTVQQGSPMEVGSTQGVDTLTFQMSKADDGTLSVAVYPLIKIKPWKLNVKVGRSNSEYWRSKVAALEIVAWPSEFQIGKKGYVLSRDNGGTILMHAASSLSVSHLVASAPKVVAQIANPLEGINMMIEGDFNADETAWNEIGETPLTPSVVYRGGSLTAYAEASHPGTLLVAAGHNPLSIKARLKVCGGNILHICAPVGGGGGWNYGRLHLLVFASDGIYSVSIDSALQKATSTCINTFGIKCHDAVAATPEAVYVANEIGQLIRIVGSRCHMVPFPSEVLRLAWNGDRAELWAINSMGAPFVMDADGGVSLRSDVYVDRVVGQRMVVDQFGVLRSLRVELPQPVDVAWVCRQESRFKLSVRVARWIIDAHAASNLMLRLRVDNGGSSQRLLELKVDGAINAPISARVICPSRAYYTAQISGTLTPPAHLNALDI